MNREILFKAKRIDNGEWVEGYYVVIDNVHYIYTGKQENRGLYVLAERREVDPETVCRYTGMTDKNGKAIWENNKCCVQGTGVLAYGTIKYLEGCFCFVEDKTKNILRLFDIKTNGYSIKVEGKYIFDKT